MTGNPGRQRHIIIITLKEKETERIIIVNIMECMGTVLENPK
jgi:hypothetical protein